MKAVVVPNYRKCEACGLDCCPVFWPRDVNSFSQIWQALATIIPSKVLFAYVNKNYDRRRQLVHLLSRLLTSLLKLIAVSQTFFPV